MLPTSKLLAAFFVSHRDERTKRGEEQKAIAKAASLSPARISQLDQESGFRIDGAEALAQAFGFADLEAAIRAAREWEKRRSLVAAPVDARNAALGRLRGLLDDDIEKMMMGVDPASIGSAIEWIAKASAEQVRKTWFASTPAGPETSTRAARGTPSLPGTPRSEPIPAEESVPPVQPPPATDEKPKTTPRKPKK